MNPRLKRPPYPHITLLAPFVEYKKFGDAEAHLRKVLKDFDPISVSFEKFELFQNKSSNTLFLDPIVKPAEALHELYKAVSAAFPNCVGQTVENQTGKKATTFEPHIGVGYFKDGREAVRLQQKYQQGWKSFQFTLKEVYMMHRKAQDSPWDIVAIVPLGKTETPSYFSPNTSVGDVVK